MHEGKTRYRDGEPVKWADPVLDDETWHTLQGVLDKRKTPRGRPQARPLKGILWCPCGGKKYYTLYRMRGYSYAYYKCRAPRAVCADSIGWPVEWVHQFIDELVLDTIGPLNEQTKTYIPGKDNGAEIADLRESIQNLSANLAALKGAAASATIDILNANSERLTELEKEPVVPARWKRENTGRTYQQVWDTAGDDWQAKTEILIRTELRVTLSGAPAHPVIEVAWPDELEQRLATPQ